MINVQVGFLSAAVSKPASNAAACLACHTCFARETAAQFEKINLGPHVNDIVASAVAALEALKNGTEETLALLSAAANTDDGDDDGHDPTRCRQDPTMALVDDVVLHILSYLAPRDLVALRQTSRAFCRLSSEPSLYGDVTIRVGNQKRGHQPPDFVLKGALLFVIFRFFSCIGIGW